MSHWAGRSSVEHGVEEDHPVVRCHLVEVLYGWAVDEQPPHAAPAVVVLPESSVDEGAPEHVGTEALGQAVQLGCMRGCKVDEEDHRCPGGGHPAAEFFEEFCEPSHQNPARFDRELERGQSVLQDACHWGLFRCCLDRDEVELAVTLQHSFDVGHGEAGCAETGDQVAHGGHGPAHLLQSRFGLGEEELVVRAVLEVVQRVRRFVVGIAPELQLVVWRDDQPLRVGSSVGAGDAQEGEPGAFAFDLLVDVHPEEGALSQLIERCLGVGQDVLERGRNLGREGADDESVDPYIRGDGSSHGTSLVVENL